MCVSSKTNDGLVHKLEKWFGKIELMTSHETLEVYYLKWTLFTIEYSHCICCSLYCINRKANVK